MEEYEEIINKWLKERGFNNMDELREHELKEQEKWQKSLHNEYLRKCNFNDIDIWKMQQSIKNNELVELDFEGDTCILIAKNEIYVKRWSSKCLPTYSFPSWHYEMYDNYDVVDYIQLKSEYYDYEDYRNYWMKIIQRLFQKCNYSIIKPYKKEDILKKIEQYWG